MGKIVALLKRKGGSGSSTLAANIAGEWAHNDFSTCLMDCDPQRSLCEWADLGEGGILSKIVEPVEAIQGRAFRELLLQRARGYDRVVVDCAPGFDPLAIQAATVADVVVIPVRPGGMDLAAAADALEVAAVGVQGRDNASIAFAPSANLPRTKLGQKLPERLAILGDPMGAIVLPAVDHRVIAAEAVGTGKTVSELEPESETAKQFREVVDALDAILGGSQ